MMFIEKLPTGHVRYGEWYLDPMTGRRRKVSVTMEKDTPKNRLAAQEKINAKLNKPQADNLTLADLIDRYRDYQKQTVKESTYTRNYYACESLKAILGADTLVSALNARYVNGKLLEAKEPAGTVNERISRFKALIRWGYQNDYVPDIGWLDKVRKQKDPAKAEKLEQKYLESNELKALLDAMTVDKWKFLAQITAYSGLRVGEAIALETKDVDMDTRMISVTKTYDPINDIISEPKTAASVRDVYMQDELLDIMGRVILYMKKERFHVGYKSDLLLSDAYGNHLDYYAYNKYIGHLSEKVLGRRITSHYMRHTHVALLAENGVPLDVISRRLGHESSKVTQDVYFHVTEKLKERDNERLKDVKLI